MVDVVGWLLTPGFSGELAVVVVVVVADGVTVRTKGVEDGVLKGTKVDVPTAGLGVDVVGLTLVGGKPKVLGTALARSWKLPYRMVVLITARLVSVKVENDSNSLKARMMSHSLEQENSS